jgi:hypothetical protein
MLVAPCIHPIHPSHASVPRPLSRVGIIADDERHRGKRSASRCVPLRAGYMSGSTFRHACAVSCMIHRAAPRMVRLAVRRASYMALRLSRLAALGWAERLGVYQVLDNTVYSRRGRLPPPPAPKAGLPYAIFLGCVGRPRAPKHVPHVAKSSTYSLMTHDCVPH